MLIRGPRCGAGPGQPRPARDLHRRRVCRGRRPVTGISWNKLCLAAGDRQTEPVAEDPIDAYRSRTAIPARTRTADRCDLKVGYLRDWRPPRTNVMEHGHFGR